MYGPLNSLDSLLATLSGETWERLRDANNLSVSFGEETITDILALDINRCGLMTTTFNQTTKPEEAEIGADYEWWIGHDSIGWIRMAVQAKKLNLHRQQYNFRHTSKNNVQQIDRLDTYARKVRALPLYCLYNHSDFAEHQVHWRCAQRPFDENDLGCTVAPSRTIRRLVRGQKNFRYLHTYGRAIPWRCLVSCPRLRYLLWGSQKSESGFPAPEFQAEFGNFPCFYPELPSMLQPSQAPVDDASISFADATPNDAFADELFAFSAGNRILPKWIIVLQLAPADLG